MSHEFSHALLATNGAIATLTLNRPERLNAFTPAMEDDVRAASPRCATTTRCGCW
jgi:enoyl-CoA hydratase/carnithine racemase